MNKYREFDNYLKEYPSADGYFGEYGGSCISDELAAAFKEADEAYEAICHSAQFINELRRIRKDFQGRPTPVYHCERLSRLFGNCQIYLKREDLNHTGAHKLNHCMGEGLLAKYMGKKKIIAETGAGQHGVAIATAAAYFGMECDVYMGEVDIAKQHPNVIRMKMLGANVVPVTHGLKTLKEAVDAAFDAYLNEYKDAIYCIGSVVGPHPYPTIVRHFQSVVGKESKRQIKKMEGKLLDYVVACVGGGSNAIGIFSAYLKDKEVNLVGVEAFGKGQAIGENSATIQFGATDVYQGFKTKVLKDQENNVAEAYSIASGLDYPAVGPEHAHLSDVGRAKYMSINDEEALDAFYKLTKIEGIIPALESSHAVAYGLKLAKTLSQDKIVLVNLSGRGDKDVEFVLKEKGLG